MCTGHEASPVVQTPHRATCGASHVSKVRRILRSREFMVTGALCKGNITSSFQGMFLMCRPTKKSTPHFFHKQCYLSQPKSERSCFHCKSTEQPLAVQLKMNMSHVPLELLQMTSKMTFPPKSKTKKSDLILKRGEDTLTYKMANGKIISSEGLPEGISNDVLEKVLVAVEDKQSLK